MKVSALIALLQDLQDDHGDLEVIHEAQDETVIPVEEVYFKYNHDETEAYIVAAPATTVYATFTRVL